MNLLTWWQNLPRRLRQDVLPAVLVAIVALAPRLPGLDVFLTADEPKSWFGRSIQFLDALARADWASTFDSPAPGVTTMWAGSLGLLLEYARQSFPGGSLTAFLANLPFDPLDPTILPLVRLPIVLVATLTAVLTFLWGRTFLGQRGALLTALLLALDPFLLALTRILGHDGLVALFIWLSLIAFLRAIEPEARLNRRFIAISGIMGGLAFLTKYPSLFLGAFIALTILILRVRWRQSWPQTLRSWATDVTIWSAAAGLVFVLLWPAMWVDPVGRVMAIVNDALRASSNPHQKGSFFLGQPVPDPGPSFYPLVTFFRTTPILWLGWLLVLVGLVVGRWRQIQSSWRRAALILFAFALLYGLLVTVGGKKQDRYILPSFPALITLAALGYTLLPNFQRFNRKLKTRNLLCWLLPVIVLVQAALVLPHYPYYFTYYSPTLGGGATAARTMIVGWGEGLDRAARWLNDQPAAQDLEVVAWYSTTFEPFFNGHAIYKIDETKISRTPKPGLAADYVVLYVNQVQRELPTTGALQFFRTVPPVHTVTLHGLDYAWIYPSVKMQHVIAAEARLVGQAELLGFNLLNEDSQPLPSRRLRADQTITVQFYWEWQGKSPDEPIGLSLVDDTGQIWGWGNPLDTQARLPFEQWEDGMVARDDFGLAILPGTPPGDYYLNAWIDRPATGELVGVFPFSPEDVRLTVDRPVVPLSVSDLPALEQFDTPVVDGIRLLGFGNSEQMIEPWQPGESRDLLLFWQADQSISQNYPVTLALVDTAGTIRAEWSGQPTGGRFPSSQWQAGDIIRDPWNLALPPYVPPDDYQLTLSLDEVSPIDLLVVPVEGRPRSFDPPQMNMPIHATFGEKIELLGLQQAVIAGQAVIQVTPGQPLLLELVWQASGLMETNYTITVQLLDSQGQVRAQRDSMPLDGAAPTSSWAVGEILADRITLDIPAEMGSGPHHLLIALYHFETGERLLLPDGTDHLRIPVNLR